jgi:DNA-binding NarL/FixJ family response regulator
LLNLAVKKTIFTFSGIIVALLALFQLSKYSYATGDVSIEIIIALVALVFLGIGIYLNKNSLRRISPSITEINHKKVEELGISKREHEVLIEISKGLSNKEIGDKLFVSESTVKTHVSNLLVKLDAKRRTQAIQKAKQLQILSF